ncbi:hypothetical protein K438DRAFT_1268365 [Mycena galopus ATCC 62051]|nr:hypothetical protein K438DRAFT_1268365 [Mycena galopus ATCC 62051]
MHESLSLTNVSKLPPHLRSRAKSAANGSFSDLILLLRLVSEPTDHRRVLFLPLLFIHLDPSGIPMPKDLDSILCNVSRHPELGRITGALAALNAIAEMIEARGVVPPAAYADLWPRLYRWTLFVHAYWEVIPDMDLAATYRATAIIVLALHRDDNTKAAVNKAAGLHCILAEYWAKIVRNELSPNVQLVASIHTFLFDYDYDSEGGKDRTRFMEILEGCGGSEGHLAYLFVQQINNTVGGRVTAPATMIVNSVIQALSSHGKGRLTTAMLAHGGAKALIDAIHFAEEARHIFPSAAEKVYIGVTYLMGNFESDAGAEPVWVSQALSAGLLRLIAILGRSRRTQSDEMWFTWAILQRFLIKCLPDALVHYKIAGQIGDALPPALSITSTATFSGCVIDSFWTDFVELLKERLGALNFWLERQSMSLNVVKIPNATKLGEGAPLNSVLDVSLRVIVRANVRRPTGRRIEPHVERLGRLISGAHDRETTRDSCTRTGEWTLSPYTTSRGMPAAST